MKRSFLTILLTCLLLSVGNLVAYAGSVPPTTPLWSTPSSLVFSNTEVGLFWQTSTSSVGLAGYYIYRCVGSNCTMPSQPTFNISNSSNTFYGDSTLSADTTYSYTIAAYDTAGNISAQSSVITATTTGNPSNIVPVLGLTSPANGIGTVGETFTFNMNNSTLLTGGFVYGNPSYSWNWDFGDGTFLTGDPSVTHQYASAGTYTVRITIFDTDTGDEAFAEQVVTITPASISGLVLRLRFNGDINDYSGNDLPTVGGGIGVPAFGAGVSGHGIYLDGSAGGAYVDVKDNASLDSLSALTLSVHAMKNVASTSGTIYIKQGQYSISVASQGVSATLTNASSSTITLSAPSVANNDTNWHHYALTYNGATATLYFDGAAVASQSFSGNIANNTAADLLVGKTPGGNTFNGSLDWVRLYNQSLTLTQIQDLYNGTHFGDVNNDGMVSIFDAYLTAQYVVGLNTLTPTQITQADVSGDPNVLVYDAFLIAQKVVGLILKFPADIAEE